ncbi:hypothetical protein [Acuticoccus kandeliae]|uniref:COG3904 family protein n=1 Tax=Acuticoccus kandeliae TaxID=2073160 RepID=UPI00130062E9|nr:hypothetical protein [Acuticoccus kandeliae]
MTFFKATSGGNCETCNWIVAEGAIKDDSAEELLRFLETEDLLPARGLNIHLNSPGGSLVGGVRLGLAIREQRANTVVSGTFVERVYDDGWRVAGDTPTANAECSSACVFAFAGGVSRFASTATPKTAIGFQRVGRLGVHQFYNPVSLSDPSAPIFTTEDRIGDQKIVSALLEFLSAMGVSAELLQLSTSVDPRSIHYLTEEELRSTRMDNYTALEVSLKGYRNGVAVTEIIYQRSEGKFKLELYCRRNQMQLLAHIDWSGAYDIDGHARWNLFDNISLADGSSVKLISEKFTPRPDGGVSGDLRFEFSDSLSELVVRKEFQFEDWSSRYANNSASSLSFSLPDDFDGLHVLPRACM